MIFGLLAVSRDVDLDLLGLGLFALGHAHGQCPVAILGANAFGLYGIRQREAPHERTIGAFYSKIVVFVDFLLEFPLSADRQRIVLDANINVLLLKIGQIGLYDQLALGFVYIHGRRPGRKFS